MMVSEHIRTCMHVNLFWLCVILQQCLMHVMRVLNTNTVTPELISGCQPSAAGKWREI
jgi:hypothetical protein